MTQPHENLSAIVDGELQDDALLDKVLSEQSLADKWQSYHVIRQGLRKELPQDGLFDISAQFAEALEQEPTVLAPQQRWRNIPVVGNVVALARQSGQLAIAASVAVAVVLGVQQFNQPDASEPFSGAPPQLQGGIAGGMSPVSLEQTRPIQQTDRLEQQRRINAYLADHRQQLRLRSIAAQAQPEETSEAETVQQPDLETPPE